MLWSFAQNEKRYENEGNAESSFSFSYSTYPLPAVEENIPDYNSHP
jgi:hypothetical protein